MSRIEILAPAGSVGALQAAVRCGAAAVYLGAEAFNARQNAENFAGDALKSAVAYCHVRGVKVYLTLNTLIRENEFEAALELANCAQNFGVDALILQDVGLARCLRAILPDMPLHASTQLSCHTPDGVRFLRDNGFSRVVLSREMTFQEIQACAGLHCELEVFVHGALCMCVSGQCYLSAMLGGRSGNRGLCAQPCRLPFSAGNTADLTGGYALSLKDQSLIQYIPQLMDAGIVSLKIEGRMKRPEYVAAAVTACREAATGGLVPQEMMDDLEAVFSRSGFTDGYYTGNRGTAMFGIRRQEDVVRQASVLKRLENLYQKERQTVHVWMQLTAAVGKPAILTASDMDGHTVTVTGEAGERAHTAPTTVEKVIAQLTKTGGTPFVVTADVTLGDGVMLPASAVNALRRGALERLEQARAAVKPCTVGEKPLAACAQPSFWLKRLVRLQHAQQYSEALRDETVVLPLSTPTAFLHTLAAQHSNCFGVEIPRGLFGGTAVAETKLKAAKQAGAAFAVCGNINGLEIAKKVGLPIMGGFGMNITNAQAVGFYAENGVCALTVSPELSFAQMQFAKNAALPCGVLCYGRMPLMLTRNCPQKAAGADCTICKGGGELCDRKHVRFPVTCSNGCSELLNSVPLYWGDQRHQLPNDMFEVYHFTDESAVRVAEILKMYENGTPADMPITRGMYRKGVE